VNKLILAIMTVALLGNASPAPSPAAVYSIELNERNTITMRGEVTGASMASLERDFLAQIVARGNETYPIYLVIDSPGGEVDAGLDFIAFAQTYPNVHTVTLFAASMAAAIVEGLPGQRYITEAGILMFHRAKGGFEGQFEDGEVESRLKLAKDIVRVMEKTNAARIGINLQEYKAKVKDEWWLVGDNAVSYGGVDNKVVLRCTQELIQSTSVVTVPVMIFSVNVEFSKCPLLRVGALADKQSSSVYNKFKNQIDKKFTKPLKGL